MSALEASPQEPTIFTVDTLLKYMGGDEKALAVVVKIVRDAVISATDPMSRAGAAVRADRLDEAARIFHGLRGSIGTLGTKRFVGACLALELAIVEKRAEQLPPLLATVEHEFNLALEHANAWLALNGGKLS